ncbi:MAG: hypothetical protein BRC27_00505 [Nanohaloarchaea archaeon SW_10_44_10]|nr:MAG: hypothetical protein BRC27_00505 [Nanohaloarchaea archaeon SW_10_44_10]
MVVAMVALATGAVILFLASGQAEGFGLFADERQQDAQCSYWEKTCDDGDPKPDYCGESVPSTCPNTGDSEESGDTTTSQSSNSDSGNTAQDP